MIRIAVVRHGKEVGNSEETERSYGYDTPRLNHQAPVVHSHHFIENMRGRALEILLAALCIVAGLKPSHSHAK